jgi:3-oxoacyl-[acyl-carrier protein] reductase
MVAKHNVTINNLLPGQFDTDRLRATMEGRAKASGKAVEDVRRAAMETIPAGRFGSAQEFGTLCAFVCSAQASYLVGQNLLLDGGNYPGTF